VDRLTYDFAIGKNHCWEVHGADNLVCEEVCKNQGDKGCEDCPIRKAIDRLAAYEDTGLMPEEVVRLAQAKQDGRLVVLPCKKGDVLWSFYNWPREGIYSFCVTSTSTLDGVTVLNTDRLGMVFLALDIGKTVFLTREEAETALTNQQEEHK